MRGRAAPERSLRDVALTLAMLAGYAGALAAMAWAGSLAYRHLAADAASWAAPVLPTF